MDQLDQVFEGRSDGVELVLGHPLGWCVGDDGGDVSLWALDRVEEA
ncbi:hypothetical protein [Actinoplanes sp. NPDC023714]